MKRIPIRDRELPNYTRAEELVNMGTHIFGVFFGVAVLAVGCRAPATAPNAE